MRCGEEGDRAEARAMLAQTSGREHPKSHEAATIDDTHSPYSITIG